MEVKGKTEYTITPGCRWFSDGQKVKTDADGTGHPIRGVLNPTAVLIKVQNGGGIFVDESRLVGV